MEVIAKFQLTEQLDDKSLRQRLKEQGVEARRLSRFTQLALFGTLQFREYINAESAVYLASSFNSPTKFQKMFENLMQQQLPSPLDFMANINNAAVFHIAQTLNIQGTSLFLTMQKEELEKLFELVELDLVPQQTALIGWVFERYKAEQEDESIWWLVQG